MAEFRPKREFLKCGNSKGLAGSAASAPSPKLRALEPTHLTPSQPLAGVARGKAPIFGGSRSWLPRARPALATARRLMLLD